MRSADRATAISGTRSLNGEDFLSAQQGLPKAAFDREQWGGSLGGRIVADKTFFFGAADRSTQTTPFNNGITAQNAAIIGLPAADVGNIDQYLRDTFAMAKVTHVANHNNTLTPTYAMTYDVISNFNAVCDPRPLRPVGLHRQHASASSGPGSRTRATGSTT